MGRTYKDEEAAATPVYARRAEGPHRADRCEETNEWGAHVKDLLNKSLNRTLHFTRFESRYRNTRRSFRWNWATNEILSNVDRERSYFTKQEQKAKRMIDLAVVVSLDVMVGGGNR